MLVCYKQPINFKLWIFLSRWILLYHDGDIHLANFIQDNQSQGRQLKPIHARDITAKHVTPLFLYFHIFCFKEWPRASYALRGTGVKNSTSKLRVIIKHLYNQINSIILLVPNRPFNPRLLNRQSNTLTFRPRNQSYTILKLIQEKSSIIL